MRKFPFQILATSTYLPMTGQSDNIHVRISKDGGTFTNATNRPVEFATGYYYVLLTDSEMDYTDFVVMEISCTGGNTRRFIDTANSDNIETAKAVWQYQPQVGSTSTPASGWYCTREDVELRWGKVNVAIMADVDNDSNPTKITNAINRCINLAYTRMNSDFAMSIYKLPFDITQCPIVRKFASDLAGIELYKIRQLALSNEVAMFEKAETEYTTWLTNVYNGMDIPGASKNYSQY